MYFAVATMLNCVRSLSFNRVLSAYLKSKDPEAAQRADNIVRRMESSYERGEIDTSPDTYHYTILCGTWARSGHRVSADRVLQILVHMVERGSTYSFSKFPARETSFIPTCKSAFSRAAAFRLSFFSAEAGFPDTKPNTRTFNAALDCLSRFGEAQRCEELLYYMLTLYRNGDDDAKPDSFSFNW